MALSRRDFLLWASGAACGAAAGYPVLRYLLPPPRSFSGAGLLPIPEPPKPMTAVKVRYRNTVAIVVNDGGKLRAFDAACTHLGCIVAWDGSAADFKCRCHGGVFASDGRNVSGPPRRPLTPIPVSIRSGKLYLGE